VAKKARPDPSRDYRAGLECADGFLRLAEPFIASIPALTGELKDGLPSLPRWLGDLAACTVNLVFALELYLKTLLVQSATPVPWGHDLRPLYDALPQRVKPGINETYAACLAQWYGKRSSVTIAKGPPEEPTWSDSHARLDDLPSLLDRSNGLFEAWRYVYEFSPQQGDLYQQHEFEYGPLLCACEAVKASITLRTGPD
jgi:hypothetical protein